MTPAGQRPLDGPVRRSTEPGWYEYTVQAWIDRFASWHRELTKKAEAGQDVASELLEGAELVREAAARGVGPRRRLAPRPGRGPRPAGATRRRASRAALDPELAARHGPLPRPRAGALHLRPRPSASWSSASGPGSAPGTRCSRARARPSPAGTARFRDVEARLPYVAGMGFDVLYLPPIHPIGRAFRKGPNNTLTPGPDDPGSPWAIGGAGGRPQGHPPRARHARRLRPPGRRGAAARASRSRSTSPSSARPTIPTSASTPSGSATGPTARSSTPRTRPRSTRTSTRSTSSATTGRPSGPSCATSSCSGSATACTIFRVDNPHTKPFRFWEWVIREVWDRHPDAIFLAEAFTRPKVMQPPGQGGLFAVVQLLHLAEHQVRR